MHLWQANLLEWFTNMIHLWFTSLSHLQAKSPQADPSPSPFEELSEIPNTVRRPNHQVVQDSHQLYCYDHVMIEIWIKCKFETWLYRFGTDFEVHPLWVEDDAHECPRSPVRAKISEAWFFFRWDLSAVTVVDGSLRWQSPNLSSSKAPFKASFWLWISKVFVLFRNWMTLLPEAVLMAFTCIWRKTSGNCWTTFSNTTVFDLRILSWSWSIRSICGLSRWFHLISFQYHRELSASTCNLHLLDIWVFHPMPISHCARLG